MAGSTTTPNQSEHESKKQWGGYSTLRKDLEMGASPPEAVLLRTSGSLFLEGGEGLTPLQGMQLADSQSC